MHTFQIGRKCLKSAVFEVKSNGTVLEIFTILVIFVLGSLQSLPLLLKDVKFLGTSAPGFGSKTAPAPEDFAFLPVRSYRKSAYFPNWIPVCAASTYTLFPIRNTTMRNIDLFWPKPWNNLGLQGNTDTSQASECFLWKKRVPICRTCSLLFSIFSAWNHSSFSIRKILIGSGSQFLKSTIEYKRKF